VVDLTTVKKKKSETTVLHRSERTKSGDGRIQDKAEAAKKKANEFSGKTLSFSVFNSVDPAVLEKLASASNICLGETTDKISSSISTIQAKEIANAALRAAKKRLSKQQKQSCDEGGPSDSLINELAADKKEDTEKTQRVMRITGLRRNHQRGG
jgi:hypothetical protein